MEKKIEELIGQLETSVMFNLSLGSKELFHSNFLAWFIEFCLDSEAQCQFANAMIKEKEFFKPAEIFEVKREEKNIDLQLCWGRKSEKKTVWEKRLVIENKVKSIPYKAQLEKYSEGCSSKTERFVLLSLTDPIFFVDNQYSTLEEHNWRWVNYQALAASLREFRLDGYNGEVVRDYCEFIEILHQIVQGTVPSSPCAKNFLDYTNYYRKLRQIRIHDLFEKWRFACLEKVVREALGGNACPFIIHSAMTRGTGLLEVKRVLQGDGESNKLNIGVQLQGTQLRQFIQVPGIPNKALVLANNLKEKGLWFLGELEKVSSKTKVKEFCSYSGTFLYRYEKLNSSLSAEDVCNRIVSLVGKSKAAAEELRSGGVLLR